MKMNMKMNKDEMLFYTCGVCLERFESKKPNLLDDIEVCPECYAHELEEAQGEI